MHNPTFVLTGSGRSGTTWLAEVLAASICGRIVFEPFRPNIVPGLTELNNRQYLRPGDTAPAFKNEIEAILNGKIRSRWTDRYNHRFRYEARIIKEIRANLMVGWMLQTFPNIKVLHVVRNPFSTMLSQKRGGWKIDNTKFTSQVALMEDYLSPLKPLIARADSSDKKIALHWAIENYVPVSQYCSNKWSKKRFIVKSYDSLLQNQTEMTELFEFLGVSAEKIDWDRVRTPSRVSRGRTHFLLQDGQEHFDPETIAYVEALLDACDLREVVQPL